MLGAGAGAARGAGDAGQGGRYGGHGGRSAGQHGAGVARGVHHRARRNGADPLARTEQLHRWGEAALKRYAVEAAGERDLEKLWVFRFKRGGREASKEVTLSLGPARDVSLSLARDKAAICRRALEEGKEEQSQDGRSVLPAGEAEVGQ